MMESGREIIVGVLGQWASGKSTAAKTLLAYFGGEAKATLIDDRELVYRQAVDHVSALGDSEVKFSIEDDGQQRLDGDPVTLWLKPGEDFKSVDWSTYHRGGSLLRLAIRRGLCETRNGQILSHLIYLPVLLPMAVP